MGLSRCFVAFIHLVSSFILLHLTFSTHFTYSIQPLCYDNERSALLQFKQSFIITVNKSLSSDPSAYPKVESWKPDKENNNCCLWDGIKCDEHTGHVVKLDVTSSFLYGSINSSSSLFQLVHLQWLSLVDNDFNSSTIPSGMINLASLSYLNLSFSGFSGQIISKILELSKLAYLDVSRNSLELQNPSLANLVEKLFNLKVLDLRHVKISSLIPPALTNLTSLTFLSLRGCELQGKVPPFIGNLSSLLHLDISSNNLVGSIPNSFYEFKNLKMLDLSFNYLSGMVDLNLLLTNLKSLDTLVLSSNKFLVLTGNTLNKSTTQKFWIIGLRSCNLIEFPYFLYNQDQLVSLDLSSNKIVGQVPGWFLNISINNLLYLNLSKNQLKGFEQNLEALPWKTLTVVDLSFNNLEGPLPIPSMSIFAYLVSNNQLMGEIQPQICNLKNLYALDLSYNNLSGILPKCLGNFSFKLTVLKLQGNKFRGNIPEIFARGTNLRMIDLSNNALQGSIPQSLANCVKLKFLNLGNNQIIDSFPSWLGTLPELEVLILNFNRFYGVIKDPIKAFEFPKLRIIDLSHNRFAGNLPSKHLQCWNAMKDINTNKLTYLQDLLLPRYYAPLTFYGFSDYSLTLNNKGNEIQYRKLSNLITAIILSNNNFVGEIPPLIANLKGLRTLDLSNNNLEAHIPSSLTGLKLLESLDLSNNNLSGEIPPQLAELSTLEFFNVSNNNLTGPIPWKKQLSTFDNRSFDGNPGLYGEPLSRKCEESEASQEEDSRSPESLFAFDWKIALIGYASGTIIGLVLGHVFSIRKHEWLAKTFSLQLNVMQRRRSRN